MVKQNYHSKLLEEAVDQIATLPGIGRRSALRHALFLLSQPKENVKRFVEAIDDMRSRVEYCPVCNMIADSGVCPVCSDVARDRETVCVVESYSDVISIENTGQYKGLYHVLGGVISPMDGVGPSDLPIAELVQRVASGSVREVLLALDTNMEGETTSLYIYRKIEGYGVNVTTIARGVSFGDELEYADELTLGRAIRDRRNFEIA
ncbi:MAG: recombination protein RecR [Bacteroidales bacterium]|nr:recombination protein RecR [Bacteroidales bacterium]